jgi:hypothetical protein
MLERFQHRIRIVVRNQMKMRMGKAATEREIRYGSAPKRPMQPKGKPLRKCEDVGVFVWGEFVKLYDMPFRHDHAMPKAQRFAIEHNKRVVGFKKPMGWQTV